MSPTPPRPATPAGDVTEAVRALARASRLLEKALGELHLAHYRVLSAVASGDQRATRVAARLALGKPAISATVDSLCQRGLLARSDVESDQRAAALQLTPLGQAVLEKAETDMVAWLTALGDRTPDGPRLFQALAWMSPAIDQMAADRCPGPGR